MKNRSLLFLFSLLLVFKVVAQQEKTGSNSESTTQNSKTSQQTSSLLSGLEGRTNKIHDSYYLDPNWAIATVRFYPRTIGTSKGPVKLDSLSSVQMRVALQGNDVEFKAEDGVKVLSGNLVRTFSIENGDLPPRNFINALELNDESEQIKKGFFEILADGELKFLEYSKLKVEQPNYSASFDMGNREVKVSLEKILFSARGKELQRFTGKKDLFELMDDKKPQIEKFAKDNKLNLKNKEHLVKLFRYYNGIKKEG